MSRQSLGIYIGNTAISGVVTEPHGKGAVLKSQAAVRLHESGDIQTCSRQLLDQLEWKGGVVSCGIPLSWLSIRNLNFPFTEKNKIEQTLYYELDDHLIDSIEELVVGYDIIQSDEKQSQLLTFSVTKEKIQALLLALQTVNIDPDYICPAVVPYCQFVGKMFPAQDIIVLQAGSFSITMALVINGICHFSREIPYPWQILDFSSADLEGTPALPFDDAFIHSVSETIKRNLGFIRFHQFELDALQQVVVGGLIADDHHFRAELEKQLDMMVDPAELHLLPGLERDKSIIDVPGHICENALALSLGALEKKASVFDFRQKEFRKKRKLFTSRKQISYAAIGGAFFLLLPLLFYWVDYKGLEKQDEELEQTMQELYLDTFPQAGRIQNAYMQMKAAIISRKDSTAQSMSIRAGDLTMLDILAEISGRIPQAVSVQVSRMVVDSQSVRLRGETDNFNNVNEIKRLLALSPLFPNVQILSASADNRSGKIRFEVQMELNEKV